MKKCLFIGSKTAFTHKEIFPLVINNLLWVGYNTNLTFIKDNKLISIATWWYTNLDKKVEYLKLTKTYNEREYQRYDNYNAINVDKVINIPIDYKGIIGVPITFLSKYNPNQFEIVGEANHGSDNIYDLFDAEINGKSIYRRLLIKHKV